jgi:ABC-type multidrug transport system fused ATPase/permease subunit
MTAVDTTIAPDTTAGRPAGAVAGEADRHPSSGAAPLNLGRELFGGRAGTTVLIGLLMLVSVSATLALPLVVGVMIDAVQRRQPLLGVAALMVTAGLGAALAGAGSAYLLSQLGEQLVYRVRVRIMEHALRMRLSDVEALGSGDIASRITSDALQLKAAVDIGPVRLPAALITLGGTLVIMGLIDWVLLLITMAGFSIAVVLVIAVVVALRARYRALQEDRGALTHRFISALEALTVIKSTRSEARQAAALAAGAATLRRAGVSAAKFESLLVPAINLGQQIALLTVLVGGGARLASGKLSLAELVAFLLYLLQLTSPLVLAASGLSTVQAGLTAKSRFDALLQTPLESADTTAPAESTATAADALHALELSAVSAGYGPTMELREVSLAVPAVGLTSLVGPSGSGKTTVLRLVERLMTAESGVVRVFGENVRALDLDRLRSRIAYVDQANTLVPDTVRCNLELGLPAPKTDAELYAALEKVGLAADVRAMAHGLDTVLTTGRGLSGGQCQRLALARAVLSDAPLILLDEPTSALDARNEHQLRDLVDEIALERAVLVVAHRISTVREARHVIILDGGRVCDLGAHADLLARCDLYAELVNFQLIKPTERPLVGLANQELR